MNKPPADIWDALAESVGAERRTTYWRAVARIRQLRPDDEVLILIEAMGVLALVTAETPKALAAERAAWTGQINQAKAEMERLARETSTLVVTAGNAFGRASSSLATTASMVEAGATTVREGLHMAPSRISSLAIAEAVARELDTRLVKPAVQSVETMVATVEKLPGFVQRAEGTMRFLKDFNITWHYANAVLMGFGLAVVLLFLLRGCSS